MKPWLLLLALAAKPQAAYAPELRQAHMVEVLGALKHTPPDVLVQAYQYVAVYERGACSSSSERLRVECLLTAAKRFCQKRPHTEAADCALYSDTVVSSLLAEKREIPVEKRYDIMKRTRDWRHEMARELRRNQGALAVDFR